ncbi:MAG: alpha/beta hydrolase [Bacillota bacterium]
MRKILLLVLMLAIVVGTQYMIAQERADVVVSHERLSGNPVDRYAAVGTPRGVVLVAHGFAASKKLMQPWGYALARQGFDVYIFDQPGHGEHPSSLQAWSGLSQNPLGANLRAMVAELIRTGRAQPGKVALVGHSMGGVTVLAAGLEESAVAATVTLSAAYSDPLPPDRPAHLLSLVAERDPGSIRATAAALAPQSESRKTVDVPARNHITILYDQEVMDQVAAWIHRALGSQKPGPVGTAAPWNWILLALAGGLGALLAVAWLLIPPEVRTTGRVRPLGFLTGLIALSVASLSAVLAAVYLRLPWVGVAVLDYLLPYFAVAAAVLYVLRWLWPRDFGFALTQGADTVESALVRGMGVALAYLGAVVPVIHMNLAYHMPTLPRLLPLMLSALILWLYFVQEEGLKRAVAAEWGSLGALVLGLLGKGVIIGTWLAATALPNPPTFLTLTVPVTVVVLAVLEVLSAILSRMRYSSAASATLNAVVLSWAMAVTFPLV